MLIDLPNDLHVNHSLSIDLDQGLYLGTQPLAGKKLAYDPESNVRFAF